MKVILLSIITLFLTACASTGLYNSKTCSNWIQCDDTADCAALLYNRATSIMSESQQLAKNKLFISAGEGYRTAALMLRCANAKLAAAQLNNFEDWKMANIFGLGDNIKKAINKCDRRARSYQWRR